MGKFLKSNGWLILIILTAAFFRFWQIEELPGGLFPDEAANGLDVNSILEGDIKPFYERGNGREALFFYALAASVAAFGRGAWQHHVVSATFGILAVLATYFLTKRLFGKNVALLSAFFMAVSSYAVTLSRTAFRANTLPLFTTLTMLFLVKFIQAKNKKDKIYSSILAGVFFGLGFYTYISYRMMIVFLVGLIALAALAHRGKIKVLLVSNKKYLTLTFAGFIAAFSWIGYYFIKYPQAFFTRVGHVSIFSKDLNQGDVLGTFWEVFKKTLLAFFTQGDLNWRHNVAGFPFLPPILSPFFAAGLLIFTAALIVLLKQAWDKKLNSKVLYMGIVALWFWLMLVPEITTAEGIPHGLRLVGVIPAIFIMPAWALYELWKRLRAKTQIGRASKAAYAAIILSAILVYNFSLYFGVAASSPDYFYAFRSDLTSVSNYINACNTRGNLYLSLDKFSVQTVEYLTTGSAKKYYLLDPAKTYEVTLKPGDQVIFTQSTLFDRILFLKYHPGSKLILEQKNKFAQPIMLVYEEQ